MLNWIINNYKKEANYYTGMITLMVRYLNLKIIWILLFGFFTIQMDVYSQSIKGIVMDNSNGHPLIGAEIFLHETQLITITDDKGAFRFEVNNLPVSITIKHLGYESYRTIYEEDIQELIVHLEGSSIYLGEILVTAYEADQKINEIPGSIGFISKRDLKMDNEVYIVPALNRLPGVFMQSGSYNTNRLTIRGIGSRSLYATQKIRAYFNEIPLTTGDGQTTLEDIDPNLIRRIEIIKGPSSSLYGAGLGGTLLIKSRNAEQGHKVIGFQTTGGSYGYLKNALDLDYGSQRVRLNLSGNRIHGKGYRKNNEFDRYSIGFSGNISLNPKTSISFLSNYIDLISFIPSSLNRDMFDATPEAAAPNWEEARGFDNRQSGKPYKYQCIH